MATTYTLISSVTVGATAVASMNFTSIPATYTDLKVVISARNETGPAGNILMGFNSSTSSFVNLFIQGDGAGVAASSVAQMIGDMDGSGETANTFNNVEVYIPNYLVSQNKQISIFGLNETNATAASMAAVASLWRNTAAITSITLDPLDGAATFQIGSSFYLYGISNA